MRCLENFAARGRRRSEDQNPQLAADIRAIVEPNSYADPGLQSSRRYTNLSAAEVRGALIAKGHLEAELPSERTMRDILNRMNYRLKRIQGSSAKRVGDNRLEMCYSTLFLRGFSTFEGCKKRGRIF